jgi:CBS domain-containing protein
MNVESIMTRDPKSVGPGDTMSAAAKLMWDHDIGCVPVVDHENRVIAMLTDRDICMAAYLKNRTLTDMTVAEAMSKDLCACRRNDDVEKAEKLMQEAQVRRLPVMDREGHLVGILSLNDLAREAAREKPLSRKSVTEQEVAETLAAACQPRTGTSLAAA